MSNCIQEYLKRASKSKKKSYGSHLRDYFKVMGFNPDTYVKEARDFKEDILDYLYKINKPETPPSTTKSKINALKQMFKYYGISPDSDWWRYEVVKNIRGSKARTPKYIPTYNELKIIMAHSGRGLWYTEAFFLAGLHENIYMEISGLPPKNLLSYFPNFEENADKIVFGSDWPGIRSIRNNIEDIKVLPLSNQTIEKILGLNAMTLLGLK